MSGLAKNLLVTVVAILLAAGLAEAGARIAGLKPRTANVNEFFVPGTDTTWSVPDAELGWINKPGVSRSIEEGHASMTFWSDGRRASRSDPAPKDGVPVMVIGGSNAQSYGVPDADSFVWKLAERFPRLWFENFGGGGYSTVQALMIAKRAYADFYRARKPRLILLAFDDSHIARNVADQSWIFSISDPDGRYVVPPHDLMQDGKLRFYPYRTIGYWPLEKRSALITVAHDGWLRMVAYNTAREAMPVTRAVIAQLADLARQNDAAFAVAVLEDRSQTTGDVFAGASFPVVDCSAPARANPRGLLLGGNSHPNAKLHAYFADCIGRWLETTVLPRLDAAEARK